MVCLWRVPDDHPARLIGEYQRAVSPDRFEFRKGEELPSSIGVPVVMLNATMQETNALDCIPNSSMIPLVGPRLAKLLARRAQADIQLLSAKVIARDGEIDAFKMLNVISKVACINHAQSRYSFVPGTKQIMAFRKLSCLDECMGAHRIAREVEYLAHIIVSDALAAEVRVIGFSGVSVQPIDEIAW